MNPELTKTIIVQRALEKFPSLSELEKTELSDILRSTFNAGYNARSSEVISVLGLNKKLQD